MTTRQKLVFVAAAMATVLPRTSLADNPIVQTYYTADPAPMVHEDRLYVYTTHDEDVTVNNFFSMNDWKVYSTADMVNWTDHGTVLSYKDFSWAKGDAWAGQAIFRNGKFYFYGPMDNCCGTKIGVAVADSPIGPFKDAIGRALTSGGGYIDPTVFIDDDGQAYLYWGNPKLYYVKLNEDMKSFTGSPIQVSLTPAGFGTRTTPASDRPAAYEEGPWFYKRGSLYYMIYPADSTPEKISYSTASGPTGPWTFRGDIMPKQTGQGGSFTNHPGVADFKGKSYFFYHNAALSNDSYKRSVCVEEFTYGDDGSIPSIKMTKEGPAPVAPLNPFQQVEAETIAYSSGLKTEKCTDTGGGVNVSAISNNDYIKIRNVDFADGVTSFEARVSSSASNAKIELHLDSQTGTSLGTCDVSGASSWTTKTCTVSGGSGKHDLFMKFVGGSGDLFKFNWWKFTGPTMPSDADGGAGGADGGSTTGTGGKGGAGGAGGASSATGGKGGTTGAVAGTTTSGAGGKATGGRSSNSGGSGGAASGGVASSSASSSSSPGSGGASSAAASSSRGGSSSGGGSKSGASSQASGGSSASSETASGDDSSGCSCHLGARRSHGWLPALALMLIALGAGRRSRRSR